ncbi:keto-hydroxyglutarate-aldolase/keto-deoxy-phosphogluconate aldolase [Streptococcus pneumoniae]|nr:keto-hydroxyglutarate-aldolase/keto-deoxy-phosphogluconate aldolase [Streptococcus pneumoniae]
MTKSDTIIELKKQKIVAVIRGNTKEEGLQASIACIKGGIKAIEIAYTNQYAGQIIKELVDLYQDDQSVCIGAGTVLDAVTARDAILAGANYVVSPSFHAETAKMCNLYSTPYIPGCITLTEITTALEAGSEIIKLFPGSTLSPAYISAVKAPIPQVSVIPNHSYLSQLDVTYKTPDLMSHFLPPHEVSFTFCCSSIVFPR